MALGRAYGSSTFFISVAEMNCSGTTRTSKRARAGRGCRAWRDRAGQRLVGGDDVVAPTAVDHPRVVPAQHHLQQVQCLRRDTGLGVARVTVPCTPGAIT